MLLGIKDNPRWPDAVMYAIAYPNQEKRSLHDFDLAMIEQSMGEAFVRGKITCEKE